MPEEPVRDDPVTSQSMSVPLLLAALLLVVSLVWALYDEFYGLRPWKSYQRHFVRVYTDYLEKKAIPEAVAAEKTAYESAEFKKIEEEIQAAEASVRSRKEEISREVRDLERRIVVLRDVFSTARGEVTALLYTAETSGSESSKQRRLRKVEELKRGPYRVELPVPDGTTETLSFTYEELEADYLQLQERKAALLAEQARLLESANALRDKRDLYLQEHRAGLSEQQLRGLVRQAQKFKVEIKQIHVVDTDLVDRCESCHVAIQQPLTLTAADMGGARVFASHPNRDLLRIHDPERFGCSPCHGGNGRAVTSVSKAHGRYKHWLWPLYYRENAEAGCQQCHAADMVVEHAEVLNRGKELFRLRGCIGCHRYEGFDDERERLNLVRQQLRQLDLNRADHEREIQQSIKAGDQASTNEDAQRLYARAENLRVTISNLEAAKDQLRLQGRDLMQEEKTVGPNLKDVRLKLQPNWVPVWLTNPHVFRPTTKMPRFRLQEDEVRAISAFVWQNGLRADLAKQPPGNSARGKVLFETRGCLACHALGEGENAVGGTFAANLSRVGEKAKYDYLVRWIHNPRQRTLPYCPREKRDLTPADYAKQGLPFRFDLDHSTCPNDGEELRVLQMAVMPSLRLSWEDARDIASYLMNQRRQGPTDYPKAEFLEDEKLFERGKTLVRHYGCAGCHEIAGLEEEGRIGTELTAEGSKPIERLDFALLTEKAKRGLLPDGTTSQRGSWYDHKGFFEQKLNDPSVFDQGKIKEPQERLRMPKPNLTPEDVRSLTTFLLGSVEPAFPSSYLYRPTDRRRDIEEGWWVVTKYNCMGCHQIRIGQQSVLMTLPQFRTPEGKDQLPPVLVGAGARLNPDWLAKFLSNPAMSESDLNRNGVRSYLQTRMPTFGFTRREIQVLVRFFGALSAQAQPYIPSPLEPLTNQEWRIARDLFTHPAAPCLKCHATGNPLHDRAVVAPNFLLAKERLKPAWTRRWLLDPASIIPGTAMPSGLFRREGDRWVFSGPLPVSAQGYKGDHADLLVRYMFQLTPEEQRRLVGSLASLRPARGTPVAANVVKSH